MFESQNDDDLEVLNYAYGLISTSKDAPTDVADPIAASMAPVQLPPESMKEYMGHFFPTRRKSSSPNGPTGNDLQKLVPELSKISYGVSKFFAFAQYCLANGSTLEDMERGDMISNLTSIANTLNQEVAKEDMKAHLTSVFSVLSQGQHHVIRDSERYKEGKDIIFSGIPGSQKSLKGGVHLRAQPIAEIQVNRSASTEGFYENERLGNYSTDLSLKVVEACEFLHKELFGEATTFSKQDLRKVHQKRWTYDFEALNQKMADYMGLPIDLKFFTNPDANLVKKFDKYLSLACIREVNRNVAKEWAYYLTHQDGTQKPDNGKLITKEGMLAAVNFGITYCINLPSEFVNYISQSESGELSLYALHTWVSSWGKYYVRPAGSATGGMKQKFLPRYIVPASRTSNLVEERKKAGYYVDEGRSDDDSLTVGPLGSLMYVPKQTEADFDNATSYEAAMEELIRKSYEHGAPVTGNVTLTDEQIVASGVADAQESIRAQKEKLEEYKGTVLSYSWDYNTVLTVGANDSFKQNNIDLQGSTVPDALTVSDYLGFDFSEEGERPIVKDFADSMAMMMLHIKPDGGDFIEPNDIKNGYWKNDAESGFLGFPPFAALFRTYTYMAIRKKVPSVTQLLEEAAKELNITTLDASDIERDMYKSIIRNDLSFQAYDPIKTGELLKRMLTYTIKDAEAGPGSNLRAEVMNEIGPESFDVEIKDHARYFDKKSSTMADFGNLYSYLGGLMFQKACLALVKVSSKDLMTQNFEGVDGLLKDVTLPSFQTISMEVMPLAIMLGKMVPQATEYFEKAEATIDSYRKDDSIDADDIIMPGLAEGSQMFPHQIDIHRTLRKRPKFATIDVAPGGGKTISLLVDIGCVQNEDPEGIRALVICPDHLVGNWCEDMVKVSKGSWNVVPLKTEVWRRWGDEKLAEMIKNAPPNTIFVAGLNFIKSKPFLMSYGTKSVHVSGMVEFLKRFGFNYIALDESHKCKNLTSITHKATKQLTTLSNVKYVRLATGTLVHKDITDVIGQSALYSSHIFRTPGVFNYEFDSSAEDSAVRVRSKLANHSAVITKKKKEWAFMLPNPIDILVKTSIADPSNPGSEIHYEVYNAVLNDVVEQLEKEINEKKRQSALNGEGESGAAGDTAMNDDDDPDSMGHGEDFGMEEDDEDELARVDPNKLKYYMQRLEQLVTDPWGDPAGREALEKAGIKEFVPTKVKDVIGRIDNHFTTYSREEAATMNSSHVIVHWEKGMTHRELDLVEHKGETYMARKFSDTRKRQEYDSPSVKEPDQDPERWKLEIKGKVLIFCRYTRAVDAVFNGLPPKYKSIARRFHGSLDGEDKWDNLEAFKNDPNIKILIANEQSITEGQNLQMASRIIRVDSPWSPGDYDQSTARIFRPDPAAAKIDESGRPGDMPREVIFIDWMMTTGTSEVAKIARLMWRTVEKTKFDEKGNKRYEELSNFDLQPISMSLDTLRERSTVEDFMEYFEAKAMLNDIEGNEFSEMRKTTVAAMIPLTATPSREDFAIMDSVPIVASQRIADPHEFGLERMIDYMAHHTIDNSRKPDEIADMIKGLPVKTEFGNGTVVGVKFRYSKQRDASGNRVLEKRPIRSVVVRLAGSEELETFDVSLVHIATKLSDKQFDEFFRVENTWGTAKEKKAHDAEMNAIADAARKESDRREKEEARIAKKAERERSKAKKAKKRKANVAAGKPINDGVKIVKKGEKMPKPAKDRVKIIKSDKDSTTEADKRLRIIPSVYDGFIAIHANLRDPDAHDMKQFSFVPFGDYIYIETNRYERLWTIIEWIEKQAKQMKVKLDTKSEKRLEIVQEAFEDRKAINFNARLAAKVQSELPQFHRQRHIEARDRKSIKLYPMVLQDRVRLAIDLKTNPLMRKFMDRSVPGAAAKWKHHEGMNIYFAVNKTEAKRKMKELVEAGYTITNIDKALDAISQLKVTRSKKK